MRQQHTQRERRLPFAVHRHDPRADAPRLGLPLAFRGVLHLERGADLRRSLRLEADAAAEVAAEATLSGVRVTLVDLDHEPDTAERSEEPAELIGPQGVVAEHRCLVRETGAFVARAEGRVGGEELTGVEAKERRAVVAVVDEADRRLAAVTTDSSRRRSSGDKGTAGYPPQAGR